MIGRRTRRATLATVAVLATVAGACGGVHPAASGPTTAPSAAVPAPAASSPPTTAQRVATGAVLHWSACSATAGPSGYQCATVQVPLDYADPARGTIGIALDRHRATGSRTGSLLINPGGPGVSGVDYLPDFMTEVQPSVAEHFDIVGFDPRGVGRSDPVVCGTGPELDAELSVDPSPPTAAGFAALVTADRRLAAGCEARSGRILPYVGTVDAARDLDAIRAALGDAKLTYLGFSYGTYLGAVYASLFPTHIRAMVLDGALDPALGPVATIDAQSAALDRELAAFFASCAKGDCGWHPSGSLAADFDALVTGVRAHPLPVAGTGGRSVGPAALLYGAAAALYSPSSWPVLGQALSELQGGRGADILSLFDDYVGRNADGTYANTVEAETAVDCMDAPAPTLAQIRADAATTEREAPVFGLLDLYSEASCSVWPVAPSNRPAAVHADGSPPIVVVGSTDDPVTPYVWAEALAGQLTRGVLLTRDGYGHTGYGFSSCVRSDVDRYLETLAPPARGTTCASD
jgi:pimeloyl-ACP methyl ester carboxylesterase